MSYQEKYLKYKNKYLDLKKQIGNGNSTNNNNKIIFIISSHHNRMISMIFDILSQMGKSIPRYNGDNIEPPLENNTENPHKVSFILNNCTTLKIFKENNDIKINIKMIYPFDNNPKSKFKNIEFINNYNLSLILPDYPDNLIIYLVRHGEGYHNISNNNLSLEKIIDAELTENGIVQVNNCSTEIINDIKNSYENYNIKFYFGGSHLKRTWQTVSIILNKFKESKFKESNQYYIHEMIYIIPCIQEMIRAPNTEYQYIKCKEVNNDGKIVNLMGLSLNPLLEDALSSDNNKIYKTYKPLFNNSINENNLDTKRLLLENTPKCYMINKKFYNNNLDYCNYYNNIKINWDYYKHIYKNISNDKCSQISILSSICRFYYYLKFKQKYYIKN